MRRHGVRRLFVTSVSMDRRPDRPGAVLRSAPSVVAARRCGPMSVRFLHWNIAMICCVGRVTNLGAIIQPEKISCRRRLQDTTNKLQST
jgi:hypothetical protein